MAMYINGQAFDLPATIERAKQEILKDVRAGHVPDSCQSFSELHDHVDANGYGGAFEVGFDEGQEFCEFWNQVQDAVDQWIKQGGLKPGESR